MLTDNFIKDRMAQYQTQLEKLQSDHDIMVRDFQQKITANQTRFAQITGAIAELKELLQHELPDQCSRDGESSASARRIPDTPNRFGDHMGPVMGDRKLDKPDPAPGQSGAGHYTADSRYTVGDGGADGG